MNLSIKERLIILNILPNQETYANMLVVRDLKAQVGFSEEDHRHFEIVEEDGNVTWNPEKTETKDIAIGITAFEVIKKAFRKIDSDGGITVDFMDIYKRFVEDEPTVDTQVVDIDNARTG